MTSPRDPRVPADIDPRIAGILSDIEDRIDNLEFGGAGDTLGLSDFVIDKDATSGLTLAIKAGQATTPIQGELGTLIDAGTLTLPNDSDCFVYYNGATALFEYVLSSPGVLPFNAVPIAEVITSGGEIQKDSIVDGRAFLRSRDVRTHNDNTAAGTDAQPNIVDGTGNAAYGARALAANTAGNNNTAIGDGALASVTTGENNVGIGQDCDTGPDLNNVIVIGAEAQGNASNTAQIGHGILCGRFGGAIAVASLPSAATVGAGAQAFVTDANTTFALGVGTFVVGGGANKVPVYSDGTDWLIG